MGFGGGGKTELPKAEKPEPIPAEEGSNKIEAQRRARIAAGEREGYRGHTHSRPTGGGSTPKNQGARGETVQGQAKGGFNSTPARSGRRSQARMVG